MRILIADDHPIVRKGVKQILSQERDIKQIEEASNAKEVFDKVSKKSWDILILDINLPDMSGLDVLRHLKKSNPKLPVLILTVFGEDQIALRVVRLGASGFMTKDTIPEELVKAIKKISKGGKYLSEELAEELVFNIYKDYEKPLHENLSDREFQVICMIASGKSVKQIAEELYLSPQTVRTYRSRILTKMSMKTDAELIAYALKNNLVYSNSA